MSALNRKGLYNGLLIADDKNIQLQKSIDLYVKKLSF